jgi:3-phytase/alkaline phosphatase D
VTITPASAGGSAAARDPNNNGSASASHVSDPKFDTADFNDSSPGNQRVDYVLPSATLTLTAAGVFWPVDADPGDDNSSGDAFDLVGQFNKPALYAGLPSSDHKLVYVDVLVPAP